VSAVDTQAQPRAATAPPDDNAIARYFRFAERGTTFGTEVKAGVTTFMVMAYILFVNPNILSNMFGPGTPAATDARAPLAAGTALVAGLLSIAMGLVANVPIALAAGLGINGLVAFFLVLTLGLTPAGAMGVIVLEGIIVLLLVIVGLREAVMNAVPTALKKAIAVGIGLFILFIGFVDGGLITKTAGTAAENPVPVAFVFPNSPIVVTTLIGLLITVILFARRVPGALLLSILITTVIAVITGVTTVPPNLIQAPNFSTLGQFNVVEPFNVLGPLAAILVIFSFMLTDFFDTMGTATAISDQAGLTDERGRVPNTGRLLAVDSIGAIAGGAAGVSSNTSYIESAAGVAEGGRTGLTAVVVGLLFLVAILATPLATMVPFSATAPVLIVVGYLMVTQIRDIDFGDVEEGFPALLALILMPLTFSITVGIGAGFVAYVVIKVVRGRLGEIHPLLWIVAIAFVIYFAQNWLGTLPLFAPPAA
jgi:AGZA family xanthine/uracil permease-like MFS transporter